MFVVADQEPLRVRRQRRLARARQPEEQRRVAVLAHVGGTVHRQNALQGQLVVHHAEDALLHLAAVLRTHHQRQVVLQIEAHERLRVEALTLPVLVHQTLARVDHRELRLEVLQLLRRRAHEHVRHEVVLPRVLRDEAHAHVRLRVRAAEAVEHVHLLAVHVLLHVAVDLVERLLGHRLIRGNRAPPDVALGRLSLHEVLVLRRTARVDARVHLEGARVREHALLVSRLVLSNFLCASVRIKGNNHKSYFCAPCRCSVPACRDPGPLRSFQCCGRHNL